MQIVTPTCLWGSTIPLLHFLIFFSLAKQKHKFLDPAYLQAKDTTHQMENSQHSLLASLNHLQALQSNTDIVFVRGYPQHFFCGLDPLVIISKSHIDALDARLVLPSAPDHQRTHSSRTGRYPPAPSPRSRAFPGGVPSPSPPPSGSCCRMPPDSRCRASPQVRDPQPQD